MKKVTRGSFEREVDKSSASALDSKSSYKNIAIKIPLPLEFLNFVHADARTLRWLTISSFEFSRLWTCKLREKVPPLADRRGYSVKFAGVALVAKRANFAATIEHIVGA